MQLLSAIPYPRIDPVLFELGPIAVRWYGLAYVLGFLLAWALLRRMARNRTLRIAPDKVADLIWWAMIGVIVGGRLGWWLFYHRAEGPEAWYEIFAIWHGGMSFHGALIGVAVSMLLWARYQRISMLNLADCAALVAPIGLFFGRLANFINAELVGRPTDLPWGMVFPGHAAPRHPSQLYEALLEGPLLLGLLWLIHRKFRPCDGTIGAWFLILYGVFRFMVEFTREPDEQLGFIAFGWLTMGQFLSFVLVVAGALMMVGINWRKRTKKATV